MNQSKADPVVDPNEEFIDVSGDDPEIQHIVGSDPNIMRSTRFKRQRRQPREGASSYNQYPRRIITRNVRLDDIETFEEIEDDAEEDDRQPSFNHDIEMEISRDVDLMRKTQTKKFTRNDEYSDFGPIKFKFDSTQRKKQVIVYNSTRYPGRASEWYFARRNNSTANETYRCVQCRRYREEAKKNLRQGVENSPEARIMVQNDRFLTDPDEPLGKHICDFDTNDRTTLQSVWCRRALSKANSELRLRPEKPKEKFNQLLREIRCGKEYAHLPMEVREQIITELDSKKGFASRRRSFARNNRYGQQQYVSKDHLDTNGYGQVMYYLCGMDQCKERFATSEERAQHRSFYHSNVLFIDTKEEYEEYKRLNGQMVSGEELVVANEQIVLEDQIKNETGGQYEVIINDEAGEEVYNKTCQGLESIHEFVVMGVNDPTKREALFNYVMECERACRELLQSSETVEESVVDQMEDKLENDTIVE